MSHSVALREFRFGAKGSTLSLSLSPGQMLAVYGPSGAGKTRFLRTLAGLERRHHGSARVDGEVALAGHPELSRRTSPEARARRAAGRNGASRAAEALGATQLWEDRKKSIANLSPGQIAAAEMLDALASPSPVLLVDGQLERLDPWRRSSVRDLLFQRQAAGATVVLATSLCEWMPIANLLLVLKAGSPAFVGSFDELQRRHGKVLVEVETIHEADIRALCDPFEVKIESTGSGLKIESAEGQALAGRLLLEGYGNVKAILERPATAEEILAGLI